MADRPIATLLKRLDGFRRITEQLTVFGDQLIVYRINDIFMVADPVNCGNEMGFQVLHKIGTLIAEVHVINMLDVCYDLIRCLI